MPDKAECLERYQASQPKRRAYAQQVIEGKRGINPAWPMWVQYDIRAEIELIHSIRRKGQEEYRRHANKTKEAMY